MLPDFDIRLAHYINSVRNKPFDWGKHDCLTFANSAIKAMTGDYVFNDWLGDYDGPQSAYKHYRGLLTDQGYATMSDALDARLCRLKRLMPPRGALIGRSSDDQKQVTGLALGIAVSDLVAFVSDDGLIFTSVKPQDMFWCVK